MRWPVRNQVKNACLPLPLQLHCLPESSDHIFTLIQRILPDSINLQGLQEGADFAQIFPGTQQSQVFGTPRIRFTVSLSARPSAHKHPLRFFFCGRLTVFIAVYMSSQHTRAAKCREGQHFNVFFPLVISVCNDGKAHIASLTQQAANTPLNLPNLFLGVVYDSMHRSSTVHDEAGIHRFHRRRTDRGICNRCIKFRRRLLL